jgi:presenilin-like A22 family membrane protease
MKYRMNIVLALVLLFFASQIVGLGLIYQDIEVKISPVTGAQHIAHPETAIGPRPQIYGYETFLYVLAGVLIGTGLILVIIKLDKLNWWKILFFIAVLTTITISLGVIIPAVIAFLIAIVLAFLKMFKSNLIIHNITELFIYSGIAILFVPLLDIWWAIALLLVISAYDAFAVWKSKHMVKMAQFQTGSRVFAGLMITFDEAGKSVKRSAGKVKKRVAKSAGKATAKVQTREAILGGGDIAFPLIFAGVVMEGLVNGAAQLSKEIALLKVLIIPVVLAIVLYILLVKGEEGKFYPAMPFITAGCLVSYILIMLI